MPGNSNGLQVVRAQVRFFQSVPRSEETHDLSVVKQWIGWTSCKKIEKGLVEYDYSGAPPAREARERGRSPIGKEMW